MRLLFDVHLDVSRGITREMWEFWMPMVLAGVFCGLVMITRFRLLKDDNETLRRERGREAMSLISGIALAVSMIGSQHYISSQSRELILVDSLSNIGDPRPGDCFDIGSSYIIDTESVGFLSESRSVPKRHGMDELDLIVYVAIPMRESDANLVRMVPAGKPGMYTVVGTVPAKYWFVKEYEARVARPFDADIKIAFDKLGDRVESDLSSREFRRFLHLSAAPRSEKTRSMLAAIENSPVSPVADPVILSPEYKPFSKSRGGLWIMLVAWVVALFTVVVFTSFYHISAKRFSGFRAGATISLRERFDLCRLALVVKKGGAMATYALIGLNIVYFIVVILAGISPISPSPAELFEVGGATTDSILNDEVWRIATAMFLHAGFIHLTYNMVTLFIMGMMVEPIFGSVRYTVIYLASGVGAALLSMAFLDPSTVHVGASGAIFGVMGAMWAVWIRDRKKHGDYPLLFLCFGGISLLLGLMPGINNWAHIGGLVTGFALGMLLHTPPKKRHKA